MDFFGGGNSTDQWRKQRLSGQTDSVGIKNTTIEQVLMASKKKSPDWRGFDEKSTSKKNDEDKHTAVGAKG